MPEAALGSRSAAAVAGGLPWSAGGVCRGAGTVAWEPRSATDFPAEVAVPGSVAAGLARTGVSPEQVSRPDGGADSAEVPALPIPRVGSSADRAAGAGVLPSANVPSGGVGTPSCSCAPRFAGEVAPPAGPAGPAGPSCGFGSGAWPALASSRLPPLLPRGGRAGS